MRDGALDGGERLVDGQAAIRLISSAVIASVGDRTDDAAKSLVDRLDTWPELFRDRHCESSPSEPTDVGRTLDRSHAPAASTWTLAMNRPRVHRLEAHTWVLVERASIRRRGLCDPRPASCTA